MDNNEKSDWVKTDSERTDVNVRRSWFQQHTSSFKDGCNRDHRSNPDPFCNVCSRDVKMPPNFLSSK